MHSWGDEGVDWAGISNAAHWIGEELARWGRIGVTDTKEKYGTVRVYCHFGWHQLHSVTHPRYHYSQYPRWLWNLDCTYLSRLMPLFNWAVIPTQKRLYRHVYRRALLRWPHLAGEILMGADWTELLVGLDPRLVRTWDEDCWVITWEKEKP